MAIGADSNDIVDSPGYVRVYKWQKEAYYWEERGPQINGEADGDRFGKS